MGKYVTARIAVLVYLQDDQSNDWASDLMSEVLSNPENDIADWGYLDTTTTMNPDNYPWYNVDLPNIDDWEEGEFFQYLPTDWSHPIARTHR